jgi:biotin carboxyl carrier protein
MKKRGMILAIVIICAFCFTACGLKERTSNDYMTAQEAISKGEDFTGQIEQIYAEYSTNLNTFYKTCEQKNSSDANLIMAAVKSWDAAKKELGDTITVKTGTSTAEVSDDKIVVMVELQGSEADKNNKPRTAQEKIVFTKKAATEFTTVVHYGLSEKLQQSAGKSLTGFLTLILIAIVMAVGMGLFRLITGKSRKQHETEILLTEKERNEAIDHTIQNIMKKEEALKMKELSRTEEENGKTRICAGVSGKVIKICVTAGQSVKRGDPVIILETMKMEIPQVAPKDGEIEKIMVTVGELCDAGTVLAVSN